MNSEHTRAPRGFFRRAAALFFLLVLGVLAACPAFADAATEVWVNGVEITAQDAVMPDGVLWDGSTLTLNGANLTGTHEREYHEAAISANGDLTIHLAGTNTITVSGGSTAFLDGIYANGVVTIEGDGSLTVTASGSASEVNGLATGYTEGDAGLVMNSGTVTLSGSGGSWSRGLYLDNSYSTSLPPRYLKVNGGTLTLIGESDASTVAPNVSNYAGSVITACLDTAGTTTTNYYDFNCGFGIYKYLRIVPLSYDENGFAAGDHYQPAAQAADGVYEISNAGQLFWFSEKVAEDEANAALNARLTADIAIPAGRIFDPISAGPYNSGYAGTFDGQGHTVTGMVIQPQYGFSSTGFVTCLQAGGVVKNLRFADVSLSNSTSTAGVVCGLNRGRVENCHVQSAVFNGALQMIGGIAGENEGVIALCSNAAPVAATGSSIGGIAGWNRAGGSIENCWNTGSVTGGWYVGGIAGQTAADSAIRNCYSAGAVTTSPGYETLGTGIAGDRSITPENSYYLAAAETADGGRTQARFSSGEVAWLLNGGETPSGVWGQTLSGDGTQSLPALGGAPVYKGWAACWSDAQTFSNDPGAVHDAKPAHAFTVLQQDEASHWHACANDGCTAIDGKEAHCFDVYTSNGDATCTTDGTETAVCAACGATHTRASIGSAPGHTGGRATCDELAVCSRCGSAYGGYDAGNHVGGRVTKNAVAATCTTAGYTGDVFCVDCGVILERGTVIPAGHQFQNGACLACGAQLASPTGVSLPQTGDGSSLSGWSLLLAVAGVGLAAAALARPKAKAETDAPTAES